MDVICGKHRLRAAHRPSVVTIGSFDGVHLGHRAILGQVAALAHEAALPSSLITFEPHPREFLAPAQAPARLARFREKIAALGTTSLERVVCLRFDESLAALPAERFIAEVLCARLGAKHVVVGDDFRFGYKGEGDFALLERAGVEYGFTLTRCRTYTVSGRRVSSSWVRDALGAGELDLAAELLGRAYSMCGRVVRGQQLGRTLGFPTANVALKRAQAPLSGIFAVRIYGLAAAPHHGVASLGIRPTIAEGLKELLEIHLFDFDEDIYGREIRVEFLQHLRAEQRFDSLDALTTQMARDAEAARAFFDTHEL